jgi:Alginate lyase
MYRGMRIWFAAGAALLTVGALALVWTAGPGGARPAGTRWADGPSSADGSASGAGSSGPSASGSASASASAGPSSHSGFVHPGVLVDTAQLDFMRGKVQAGAQPWTSAYNQLRSSASLSRGATPRADVDCGSHSVPDNGCSDERGDALAAYGDALVWYVTRDSRYADAAIRIMDAWSATLKTHTNSNAPLQTGWAGAGWSKAAELIKSTVSWPNAGRFAAMLRNAYLPVLSQGSGANGNWELIMTDALMGIAVFLDDRTSFNRAVALWRGRVPAYIYLKSDGPAPKSPPGHAKNGASLTGYWYGQTTFVDGVAQETCRDFGHTAMGFNAAFHAAETARIQGVDLWGEQKTRLAAGLEFHAQYELGAAAPSWLCGGQVTLGTGGYWEAGYNALHTRLGMNLPNTARLLASRRPVSSDNHSSAYETLTSFDNPD